MTNGGPGISPTVTCSRRRRVIRPGVLKPVLLLLAVLTLANHGHVPLTFAQTVAKSDMTPQDFLETYRRALDALEREHAAFEAEAMVREIQSDATRVVRNLQMNIQCFADLERNSFQFARDVLSDSGAAARRPLPERRIRSVAPQGVFELTRGSRGTKYQIQRIGDRDRNVLTAVANQEMKPVFLCAFHPLFVSMRSFLENPEVRIQSIEKIVRPQGGENVVVTFDLPEESFGADRAVIEFAPEIGWRIQAYRLVLEGKSDRKSPARQVEWIADIDYQSTDGFIAPHLFKIRGVMHPWSEGSKPYVGMEKQAEINRFQRKAIPQGQFLLSAFDLPDRLLTNPEPAGRSRTSTVWLLVANVAVVLVLLAIYRRRRSAHAHN